MHSTTHAHDPKPIPSERFRIFLHALLFVLGFSLTFIVGWGGTLTLFGQLFRDYKTLLAQVGGLVVIVFGLANLGLIQIPFLNYDTRPEWDLNRRTGFAASVLMGVFFAAGWTPCIGTTLGAILTLGMNGGTTWQAMFLASGYALGLGIPFLIIGLGIDRSTRVLRRLRRHMRKIQILSGVMLIGIGVLLMSNQMVQIAIWAQRNGLYIDLALGRASTPSYFIAIIAGCVSFLSPCVLPLVPAYISYLAGHAGYTTTPKNTDLQQSV